MTRLIFKQQEWLVKFSNNADDYLHIWITRMTLTSWVFKQGWPVTIKQELYIINRVQCKNTDVNEIGQNLKRQWLRWSMRWSMVLSKT